MIPDRPLYVPLKREWFEAFATGEKTIEWRRYGPKWNERTCRIGRRVTLALGYQGRRRLYGTLIWAKVAPARDAVGELFGDGTPCMVFGIMLDPTNED